MTGILNALLGFLRSGTAAPVFTVVQKFTASGSWTCPEGVTSVEYLVVAGGASGGGTSGGGGGAGGFRTGTGFAVTAGTTYTVTVGGGGAGGASTDITRGNDGSSSVFGNAPNTITSAGGGGGGAFTAPGSISGKNGGSGGGAGRSPGVGGTGNTPVVSPSQGNNGGTASDFWF